MIDADFIHVKIVKSPYPNGPSDLRVCRLCELSLRSIHIVQVPSYFARDLERR